MIPNIPLAERMRPSVLEKFLGQKHLVGKNGVLRKMLENNTISSIILWGPPGIGKTTLARIIANKLKRKFYTISAINSGVKEVREILLKAKKQKFFSNPNPILFIDEIHRFSKSQQDSLLGAVEDGTITLIGATTENPSFEVISPLLSRCQVYTLKPLEKKEMEKLISRVINEDYYFKEKKITIKEKDALFRFASGDARKLMNILELLITPLKQKSITITNKNVIEAIQENPALYDKDGEQHYDIISAMIKSIRGGDPDAAVYWMARMIEGGEDPKFIARRLVISASEDIGLANPNALLLATACFDAVNLIGMPESRIILSQTAIYLATSPKSNAAYLAIEDAQKLVRKTGNLSVPLHLRNAPTKLMKDLGYAKDYNYPHSYIGNFIMQEYLPKDIEAHRIYHPQNNEQEKRISQRLKKWWESRYD